VIELLFGYWIASSQFFQFLTKSRDFILRFNGALPFGNRELSFGFRALSFGNRSLLGLKSTLSFGFRSLLRISGALAFGLCPLLRFSGTLSFGFCTQITLTECLILFAELLFGCFPGPFHLILELMKSL